MDFVGRYAIPAPPEVVWASLNDPEVLKTCITGCESLIKVDATHYSATAILKIGPVKATFKANIEQTDLDPPHRCILKGEGQGGVAGFARGEAEVILTPEAGGTVLSYTAKATIGGKLAQIGQRLIDGAARQIADDFFSRFASLVAASVPDPVTPIEKPLPDCDGGLAPAQADIAKREGAAPEIWVVGLIGVIVILLALFGLVLRPA
jgi:carbon monoxide dehydrogenase subunit G